MRTLITIAMSAAAIAACSPAKAPAKDDAMVGPSPVEAPAPPAPAKPAASQVPAAFLGKWDTEVKSCGTGMSDGKLTIAADRIDFYESSGPITAVAVNGPREVVISTTLSGEGETWTDKTTFRLSDDGKTLTDVSDPAEEHPFVRVRCPG